MTPAAALSCPHCRIRLEPICWHDVDRGVCRHCQTEFEFQAFPALTASRSAASVQSALPAADSVCFFHDGNRAEAVCDGCGRFLCPVCTIQQGNARLCSACIAGAVRRETVEGIKQRTLYDNLALALAVFPLILFPSTIFSAPGVLGVAAVGWSKPGSLARNRHWRFVLAVILAAAQIVGWIALIKFMIAHRIHPPRVHRTE